MKKEFSVFGWSQNKVSFQQSVFCESLSTSTSRWRYKRNACTVSQFFLNLLLSFLLPQGPGNRHDISAFPSRRRSEDRRRGGRRKRERRGSIRAAIRTHPNTASGCSPLCTRRKTDTGLGTFPCCLFPLLSPISIGRSQRGCLLGCSWQRVNTAIVFRARGFIVCEPLQVSLGE